MNKLCLTLLILLLIHHTYYISAVPVDTPFYGVVLEVLNGEAEAFYDAFYLSIEVALHKLFTPMASLNNVQ